MELQKWQKNGCENKILWRLVIISDRMDQKKKREIKSIFKDPPFFLSCITISRYRYPSSLFKTNYEKNTCRKELFSTSNQNIYSSVGFIFLIIVIIHYLRYLTMVSFFIIGFVFHHRFCFSSSFSFFIIAFVKFFFS